MSSVCMQIPRTNISSAYIHHVIPESHQIQFLHCAPVGRKTKQNKTPHHGTLAHFLEVNSKPILLEALKCLIKTWSCLCFE